MPVVNAIDTQFATCEVKTPREGVTSRGRYRWTRKSDGFHVVEVRTMFGNKTRKVFDPEDVTLFDATEVVYR